MRNLLPLSALLLGLLGPNALAQGGASPHPSPVPQPNVVLIVMDDVGFEDLAAAPTPTLDLYAPFARRYSRFYVSPVCSPTRYMLQTGLWGHRDFVGTALPSTSSDERGLVPSRLTLAEALQAEGYQTALFGKWHVNTSMNMKTDEAARIAGFQTWRAGLVGNIGATGSHYAWPRVDDGTRSVESVYSTRAITDAVLDWFANGVDPTQPFFAEICYPAPHAPFEDAAPSGMLPPTYQTVQTDRGRYESALVALDAAFAELAGALDLSNTYVILLADNGTPESVPPANALEKGYKLTVFEGGVHVPMFVWGVDTLPGDDASLVSPVDVPNTVLELTSVEPPRGFDDGTSFAATRFGLAGSRTFAWCHRFSPCNGLPGPLTVERWAVVRDDGLKLWMQDGNLRLFDLVVDPHENVDLGATSAAYFADVTDLLSIRDAILTPTSWPY
ncbi:MAG: sulfatase-like hydrolase/transferase [Planctomycetota bacterium]